MRVLPFKYLLYNIACYLAMLAVTAMVVFLTWITITEETASTNSPLNFLILATVVILYAAHPISGLKLVNHLKSDKRPDKRLITFTKMIYFLQLIPQLVALLSFHRSVGDIRRYFILRKVGIDNTPVLISAIISIAMFLSTLYLTIFTLFLLKDLRNSENKLYREVEEIGS